MAEPKRVRAEAALDDVSDHLGVVLQRADELLVRYHEIEPEVLRLRCPFAQRDDDDRDAGSISADSTKRVGQEYGDCVVRCRNGEDPSRRRGIERHVDDDGSMDLLEN